MENEENWEDSTRVENIVMKRLMCWENKIILKQQ